ncbi:MAG TPA: PIN domain-containing protein [Herpetosiphonaceae bacterium]
MNVLVDTNVVLDILLAREPWLSDSQAVWRACDEGRIIGYLLASTLTDIFYIARRIVGRDKALEAVEICLATFEICPIDRTVLEGALKLAGKDFEDDVQISAAMQAELAAIVTRNPDDFAHATIPVLLPAQLISQLS